MHEQLRQLMMLINATEGGEHREKLIYSALGILALGFAELVDAQKDQARALDQTNKHLEALITTLNEAVTSLRSLGS